MPVPITGINARAFVIPTDYPEADGTLEWDSTTLVLVQAEAGGDCRLLRAQEKFVQEGSGKKRILHPSLPPSETSGRGHARCDRAIHYPAAVSRNGHAA